MPSKNNTNTLPGALKALTIICILYFIVACVNSYNLTDADFADGTTMDINVNDSFQVSLFILNIVGLLIALKRELVGGIIGLIGFIGVVLLDNSIIFSPNVIFGVTAILFILHYVYWNQKNKIKRKRKA